MKVQHLLLVALLCLGTEAMAQTDKPAPTKRPPAAVPSLFYLEIVSTESEAGTMVVLNIDKNYKSYVTDENEQKLMAGLMTQEFTSVLDAMNFLSNAGWEYVDQYIMTKDKITERRVIMRKRPIYNRRTGAESETVPADKRPTKTRE